MLARAVVSSYCTLHMQAPAQVPITVAALSLLPAGAPGESIVATHVFSSAAKRTANIMQAPAGAPAAGPTVAASSLAAAPVSQTPT